tara:strand:+ start:839 stop:2725 length:1887 start_codon:yes stop_codon:yes gene_type:complete
MLKNRNSNLILYYNTLKYLSRKQIWYRFYYIFKKKFISFFPSLYLTRLLNTNKKFNPNFTFIDSDILYYKGDIKNIDRNEFLFLNKKFVFDNDIDWHNSSIYDEMKLWKFNINYQDYLLNLKKLYIETKDEHYLYSIIDKIESWINSNELSYNSFDIDNWNSYVISNRVICWMKIYPDLKESFSDSFNNLFLSSLKTQIEYLSKNIEHDLRGNHILENGIALLFGAYFFNDQRLYLHSKKILEIEIKEQILEDGGHFELSPMYHQHLIYRFLDCINLIRSNQIFDEELLSIFESNTKIMLGWIENIVFSNGDIPLVNDCANNVYPTINELNKYAKKLDINSDIKPLNDSGYRKIRNKSYECLIDVGQIGPDYIPGHSHNDIFSFVLYIKGNPFIVDTGISTYNSTDRRHIERSTSSHNTVMMKTLGGRTVQEQSQIWSSFRVGKRPQKPTILDESVNLELFSHELRRSMDRYGRFPTSEYSDERVIYNNYIAARYKSVTTGLVQKKHRREFLFHDSEIFIADKIQWLKPNKFLKLQLYNQSTLHFHPSVQIDPEITNKKIYIEPLGSYSVGDTDTIQVVNTSIGKIELEGFKSIEIEDFLYAPEFNKLEKSKKLVMIFDEKSNIKIVF